jgi:hypothetical protein
MSEDERWRNLSDRLGLTQDVVSLGDLLEAVEKALEKKPEITQTMRGMACVVLETEDLFCFCESAMLLAQEIWGESQHLYEDGENDEQVD